MAESFEAVEGDESVQVCVVLSGEISSEVAVEVNITTLIMGSAQGMYLTNLFVSCQWHNFTVCLFICVAQEDYIPIESALSFTQQTSSQQCTNVSIVDDIILENTEQFFVSLASINPSVPVVVSTPVATVNIVDDDSK